MEIILFIIKNKWKNLAIFIIIYIIIYMFRFNLEGSIFGKGNI